MKVAGVAILYHPDEAVFKNIAGYAPYLGILYVFDNTPIPDDDTAKNLADNIVYIASGVNEGIPICLNKACRMAIEAGYDYLLTMDQDSSFEQKELPTYLKEAVDVLGRPEVAMVGLSYGEKADLPKIQEKLLLITSGSIVDLKVWEDLGGFDEFLFIDGVDTDYCLQAFNRNLTTVQLNQFKLIHNFGNKTSVKLFFLSFGRRILYTPMRLYFMTRNWRYLRKKHPQYKSFLPFRTLFTNIKNNLLFNPKRWAILQQIIRGITAKLPI